jgi:hypothetical protein
LDAPSDAAPAATTAPRAGRKPAAGARNVAQWRTLGRISAGAPDRPFTGRINPPPPDPRRADEVGRLLQSTFGQILWRLPPRVVRVSDVARWLGLDRSICQRVVIGVRDATDGLGVLERFPGVRGLEQFVAASAGKGCPAPVTRAARRALDDYARLVSAAGGSQARLVGQIEALRARGDGRRRPSAANGAPADVERARRLSFDGAVALTGLASDARVDVVMLAPAEPRSFDPRRGGRVTTVSATGMIGVEAAPYAMPLTRRSRLAGLTPVPAQIGAPASGVTPDLLLRDFTSDPPPRVTTRTEGEYLIQIFNPEDGATAGAGAEAPRGPSPPLDIVAALAFSWVWASPTSPGSNYYSVGRVIGPPARRLVFDVYLHRALPPPGAVTAHVLRPGVQGSLGDARPASRWFDRLPAEHDLVLLGGRPGDRPSEGYARLRELTKHLLSSMNWIDEAFTGYRLEVTYPVFDMEYVIAAEF